MSPYMHHDPFPPRRPIDRAVELTIALLLAFSAGCIIGAVLAVGGR